MSYEEFCPTHLLALEDTYRGEYVCPECGPIEPTISLSAAALATEARCLAESNQAMRDGVTAIVRMGHELPADVMAALARMKSLHQPCSMCGKRLGSRGDGVGDTFACPPCRKLSFGAIGGAA